MNLYKVIFVKRKLTFQCMNIDINSHSDIRLEHIYIYRNFGHRYQLYLYAYAQTKSVSHKHEKIYFSHEIYNFIVLKKKLKCALLVTCHCDFISRL